MVSIVADDKKTAKTPRRTLIGFEPSGPIAEMIRNEQRSGQTKTRVIENCIAVALRRKYPKLAWRYDVLREEAMRS